MKRNKLEHGHIINNKSPLPGDFKRLRENEIRHKENKKKKNRRK